MEQLSWWLTRSGSEGTLLLVAVEASPSGAGVYPCRVMGAVSPLDFTPAPPSAPSLQPGVRISQLLTELGVPANLLGFAYLLTGLTLIRSDPSLCRSMTRGLYPGIALQHGTSARSVERAIRHAIAAAWERTGGQAYRQTLGRLASFVGERPTNSEFLAQVSECLRRAPD